MEQQPIARASSSVASKHGHHSSHMDFVQKLYSMLEDESYNHIVRWSGTGDTFIVFDTNEFTKSILPTHFKHSNFASFVRQLNKYDFHKVRNVDDKGVNPYGEGSWEFKHNEFHVNNKRHLDTIKRKAPSGRKIVSTSRVAEDPQGKINRLQHQVESMMKLQEHMNGNLQSLAQNYQSVVSEMVSVERNMSAQDSLMKNLVAYVVTLESERKKLLGSCDTSTSNTSSPVSPPSSIAGNGSAPFVPSQQVQQLISSYVEVAKASFDQMSEMTKRVQSTGNIAPDTSTATNGDELANLNGSTEKGGESNGEAGLRVYTDGHLAPRDPANEDDANGDLNGIIQTNQGTSTSIIAPNGSQPEKSLRVRRAAFVPGWAVPPKVLLVEDDDICRRLSTKFLQVDGISAVNKMNLTKYDLVLMDIVMPNLDGVSATSLIRQFDPLTPIISMTSNVHSGDVMTYFSHGMNDVLPKPFSKNGLLGILEKHLIHLIALKEKAVGPRELGVKSEYPDSEEDGDDDNAVVSAVDNDITNQLNTGGSSDQELVPSYLVPQTAYTDPPTFGKQPHEGFTFTDDDYMQMLGGYSNFSGDSSTMYFPGKRPAPEEASSERKRQVTN